MTIFRGATRRWVGLGVIVMSTPALHATGVLYDQNNACGNTYIVSKNTIGDPYYESRVADDFFVPAGATWSLAQVVPTGGYFGGAQTAASFDVFFYEDAAGSPGNSIPACANAGISVTKTVNLFTAALQNTCSLSGGAGGRTYWFSAQANLADSPYTDWAWRERTVQTGNKARIEHPGGAGCIPWGLKTDCVGAFEAATPDQCFALVGDSPIVFSNGFDGAPGNSCADLPQLKIGSSGFSWTSQSSGMVTYGDGTSAAGIDLTTYTSVWNEGTANPWPGTSGLSVRPATLGSVFLTERFTADGSVVGMVNWVNDKMAGAYNATNNAASYAISKCAGDFGQAGTQLGPNCSADISSTSGLTAVVSNSPQPGVCTLTPGNTYYLNIVQASLTGVAQSGGAVPSCSTDCAPWTVRQ